MGPCGFDWGHLRKRFMSRFYQLWVYVKTNWPNLPVIEAEIEREKEIARRLAQQEELLANAQRS